MPLLLLFLLAVAVAAGAAFIAVFIHES